jgi:hypothetical protein
VLLLVIAAVSLAVPRGGLLLAEVIVLRASVQAADVNVSLWQRLSRPVTLIVFAGLRYGLVAAILFGVGKLSGNFELGLGLATAMSVAIFLTEQAMLRRLAPDSGLTWQALSHPRQADRSLLAGYFSLSLAAGLNFLPQVLLRYQLVFFGTLAMLGHFSVQYQISILAIPLITALSQQALARVHSTWADVRKDILLIGGGSVLMLSISTLVFLTPASVLVGMVFKSWLPLDGVSTVLISVACAALCLTVYLGFMTVALNRPLAQTVANIIFLTVLLGAGFGLGALMGGRAC